MRFESVSGWVLQRQRNARSDGDRVTQVKCSKWREMTRTAQEKYFHHYFTLSEKKKKSKFTLEIQWIRATHGWEKNSDLIGGGMCQIVVELYVKVGQRTEGKYWFLGRFTWHVYPVVMTEESDVTFVHQDSADGDTNRNSDILKCLYKMKDDRSINFFSIEVFHELFRSSNHLLSKKPICQKMNNLLFFSLWISLGCVESCWD